MLIPAISDPRLAAITSLRAEIAGIPHTTYAEPTDQASFAVPSAGAASPEVSFAWYNSLTDARLVFSTLVEEVRTLLAQLAPVAQLKTTVSGMSAITVLRYDGVVRSVYNASSSPSFATQHADNVEHAYAVRQAFVAALSAAAGTLVSISAAAANPLTMLQAFFRARALQQALVRLQGLVDHA